MNPHAYFEELLPFYAAGQLENDQRAELENHLISCIECQNDLKLWKTVSNEINNKNRTLNAPVEMIDLTLERIHQTDKFPAAFFKTWHVLRAQIMLVQSEMWPATAIIMAMGVVVTLTSNKIDLIYFVAPLVAAFTMAVLYGPEHDPALELTLSTSTSPWKILLARVTVVSAYNLLLGLLASLILLLMVPPGMLGLVILTWLGPLSFLSALALLLSIWMGTGSAVLISYGLWILQYIPFKAMGFWMNSPIWISFLDAYQKFWHSPFILIILSMVLVLIALWSANRPVFRVNQSFG